MRDLFVSSTAMSSTSSSTLSRAHPRIAGVTLPLFSLRSDRSWGIGEIGDLPAFASWISTAGLSLIQLLPLGEIPGGETSPYSALSAFGIDPVFISMADIPELASEPIAKVLREDFATLERVKQSSAVDYE